MIIGVYIKGMEMPKDCLKCPFCLFVDGSHADFGGTCRPSLCPLVPVPTHGRLIDADALEKDIDKYIGGEESRSRFHHWVQVQSVVIPGNKGEQT